MLRRYGILLLSSLFAWPGLAFVPSWKPVIHNALLLDRYEQLAYLTAINTIAFFFAVAAMRLLNSRLPSPRGLSVTEGWQSPWGWRRILAVCAVATISPIFLAAAFGSEYEGKGFGHIVNATGFIALGVLCGLSVMWALGQVKCLLVGSHQDFANYFPFEARDAPGIRSFTRLQAWLTEKASRVGLGDVDLQFFMYLALISATHFGVAQYFDGDAQRLGSAPATIIQLVWLVLMTLLGLASLLDKGPSGIFVGSSVGENAAFPRRQGTCSTRSSTSRFLA